ncbi:MAG: hypothetical protein IKN56_00580, partial [Clostridia bacterium]|nr:hypothetical protein [Clostridia bacterium]
MKRLLIILLSLALIAGSLSIIGTVSAATETEQTYSVGDIIEYGTYPQSRVTDGETLELLNSLVPDFGEWISYNYYTGSGEATDDGSMQPGDYMKYIDITQGEEKYRAVIFTDYRPKTTGSSHRAGDAFQDDNGYYTDTIYWFLFEPLKWRVLDPGSGLVFCASAVDSQAFNNYSLLAEGGYFGNADKTYYSNDYANSSIRFWLNNSFINTAFS